MYMDDIRLKRKQREEPCPVRHTWLRSLRRWYSVAQVRTAAARTRHGTRGASGVDIGAEDAAQAARERSRLSAWTGPPRAGLCT